RRTPCALGSLPTPVPARGAGSPEATCRRRRPRRRQRAADARAVRIGGALPLPHRTLARPGVAGGPRGEPRLSERPRRIAAWLAAGGADRPFRVRADPRGLPGGSSSPVGG